ncbi:glutathione S-transferase [Spinellus fusiger]|nr:glutathione S-transferase [Spinellus fusiger]
MNLYTDRDAEFYARHPFGKVPVLEHGDLTLFESTAIGFYAASQPNSRLLGTTPAEKALIMQYTLYTENEVSANTIAWLMPIFGIRSYNKPAEELAQQNLKRALTTLDKIVANKTYLVGDEITYADICVVTSLVPSYTHVFDKSAREEFKNVLRYFETIMDTPHFKTFFDFFKYCETPLTYTPKE